MADVAQLIARIRAHGANVELDGGKLRIINKAKLPGGAFDYVKRHGKAIADFLEAEGDFEERAAILEFDGGLDRGTAENIARILLARAPSGCVPADWTWFVGEAVKIMDHHVARVSA